ncbi:MAG: hypothetical protein BAJATHORv1_100040 [Candidatus Thorarchaeota archaeon]|nr:MAG: hypothetical protein BAJATHORv1_100040 [Candidatus Thorarchaeota archaeon]
MPIHKKQSGPIISCQANLELDFENSTTAQLVLEALLPESDSIPSDRAIATLSAKGSILSIDITASDLTALRASMNSYLAWASSCQRALELLDASP